jgi:tRNA(fMet)-specific endonuclease VapC
MKYVLDTNIALLYLREHELSGQINDTYSPFSKENDAILCAVSIGELLSIARRNKWSNSKIQKIRDFTKELLVIRELDDVVIERYADIDLYSQGKLEGKTSHFTPRNMGKNDIWIAATASVLKATLITTDKDFDHLHNVFLTVIWIDPKN